jgi:hypothetical protein
MGESLRGHRNATLGSGHALPPDFFMRVFSGKAMRSEDWDELGEGEPHTVTGKGNIVVYAGPQCPTITGNRNIFVNAKNITQDQFDRLFKAYLDDSLGERNFVLGTDGLSVDEIDAVIKLTFSPPTTSSSVAPISS